MQPETKKVLDFNIEQDVGVIILLYKTPDFDYPDLPFEIPLCGKKMWKYVERAVSGLEVKTAICDENTYFMNVILPMLTDSKYSLVLFGDTPLLKKQTINDIVSYGIKNDIDCLGFQRGYFFKTDFARNQGNLMPTHRASFGDDDFVVVFDLIQAEFAGQILRNRIIREHQENGVYIMDNNTTMIDADVSISAGVTIYPNNTLLGETKIDKGVVLMPNNVVINSTIGAKAVLEGAFIKDAKIEKGRIVKAFERIE